MTAFNRRLIPDQWFPEDGKIMNKVITSLIFILLCVPLISHAQSSLPTTSAEPFKVGTFEIQGVPEVGIVLRDNLIVHLQAANQALCANTNKRRGN